MENNYYPQNIDATNYMSHQPYHQNAPINLNSTQQLSQHRVNMDDIPMLNQTQVTQTDQGKEENRQPTLKCIQDGLLYVPHKKNSPQQHLYFLNNVQDKQSAESAQFDLLHASCKEATVVVKPSDRNRPNDGLVKYDLDMILDKQLRQGTRFIGISQDASIIVGIRKNYTIYQYNVLKRKLYELIGVVPQTLQISFAHKKTMTPEEFKKNSHLDVYVNNSGTLVVISFPFYDKVDIWNHKTDFELVVQKDQFNINNHSTTEEQQETKHSSNDNQEAKQGPNNQNICLTQRLSKGQAKQHYINNFFQGNDQPQNTNQSSSNAKAKKDGQLMGTWTGIDLVEEQIEDRFEVRRKPFVHDSFISFQRERTLTHRNQLKEKIYVVQIWLYNYYDYFIGTCSQTFSDTLQNEDELKVLRIQVTQLTVDSDLKGEVWYEDSHYTLTKENKVTQLEFQVSERHEEEMQSPVIISRMDHQGQIMVTVLNSNHMIYCQIVFTCLDTDFSNSQKLFDFISSNDSPPFDARGKTNLIIDDIQWTQNDAFVILLFNTGALAILPRLGSQLMRFYNPTIVNLPSQLCSQFQNYQTPKGFNELIANQLLQQKSKAQKSKGLAKNYRKQLTMHPHKDAFLVYDGYIAYVFKMILEPELNDLFDKNNTSFYFMRFCISMNKLAFDPDILEKIPQLLTNKLPLFEFEKNVEVDEKEKEELNPAGKIIFTAQEIAPFMMPEKRMETAQSFEAEFEETPEMVLTNFKNLLMAFRWNKNLTLNYHQWLITIVNDIFFYFLRKSEPMYAYHVLRIAEYYIKEVLHKSVTKNAKFNEKFLNTEFHSSKATTQRAAEGDTKTKKPPKGQDIRENGNSFCQQIVDTATQCAIRKMKSTEELYNYQTDEAFLNKKTVDKIKLQVNTKEEMPLIFKKGNGNLRFQFSKNYILLMFYSLIQFRNYQAANFNILFLLFASYVAQRYFSKSFASQITTLNRVVFRNFQKMEKTDEIDQFFGKSGKNKLVELTTQNDLYKQWCKDIMPQSLHYYHQYFRNRYLKNLMQICKANIISNPERQQRHVSYTNKQTQSLLNCILALNNGDIQTSLNICKEQIKDLHKQELISFNKSLQQNTCLSLQFLTECIFRQHVLKSKQNISLMGLLYTITQMSIKLDKTSPINCISLHTKITNTSFQNCIAKNLMPQDKVYSQLKISSQMELERMLSLIYFQLGDLDRASTIFGRDGTKGDRPWLDYANQSLFNILGLFLHLTAQVNEYESLKEYLKDFDLKTVDNIKHIMMTTQRLNIVQSIKKCTSLMHWRIYQLLQTKNSRIKGSQLAMTMWTACSFMPYAMALSVKDEMCFQALEQMDKLLKEIKYTRQMVNKVYDFERSTDNQLMKQYPIAYDFFQQVFGDAHKSIELSLGTKDAIKHNFYRLIEVVIVSFYDQNHDKDYRDSLTTINQIIENQKNHAFFNTPHEKSVFEMQMDNYTKLIEIMVYLKFMSDVVTLECKMQEYSVRWQVSSNNTGLEADDLKKIRERYLQAIMYLVQIDIYVDTQSFMIIALNNMKCMILDQQNEELLVTQIKKISYQKLNRANKQKLTQMLELAKQEYNFPKVVYALENIIFSQENWREDEIMNNIRGEFYNWIVYCMLNKIDYKKLMQQADNKAISIVKQILSAASKVKDVFNIDFKYGFFYRGSTFEKKNTKTCNLDVETINNFTKAEEDEAQLIKNQHKYSKSSINDTKEAVNSNLLVATDFLDQKQTESEKIAFQFLKQNNKNVLLLPPIGLNQLFLSQRQLLGQKAYLAERINASRRHLTLKFLSWNGLGDQFHIGPSDAQIMQNKASVNNTMESTTNQFDFSKSPMAVTQQRPNIFENTGTAVPNAAAQANFNTMGPNNTKLKQGIKSAQKEDQYKIDKLSITQNLGDGIVRPIQMPMKIVKKGTIRKNSARRFLKTQQKPQKVVDYTYQVGSNIKTVKDNDNKKKQNQNDANMKRAAKKSIIASALPETAVKNDNQLQTQKSAKIDLDKMKMGFNVVKKSLQGMDQFNSQQATSTLIHRNQLMVRILQRKLLGQQFAKWKKQVEPKQKKSKKLKTKLKFNKKKNKNAFGLLIVDAKTDMKKKITIKSVTRAFNKPSKNVLMNNQSPSVNKKDALKLTAQPSFRQRMNEFKDQFKQFDLLQITKNTDPKQKESLKIVKNMEKQNEKMQEELTKDILKRIKSCLLDVENLGTKIEQTCPSVMPSAR